MAEARWSAHRTALAERIAAGRRREAEFLVRVTHVPSGEWAEMKYQPDIGTRLALAVAEFQP